MVDELDATTAALVELHALLERRGPGDLVLARRILEMLALQERALAAGLSEHHYGYTFYALERTA